MGSTLVQWIDRQSWFHVLIRALRLRAIAAFFLRLHPVTRNYANGTRVELADLESFFLSDEIFQRQTYRRALEAAGDVRTVVDLGCNVGYFCSYLRSHFGRTDFRGLAVDANPDMVKKARRNLKLNDLSGINLVQGLVGGTDGKTTQNFFVYASHLGSSQFIQPEEGRTLKGGWTKITVPVLKVSEVWRSAHEETPIDLLKIDIEGSEGTLLRADPALFQQTKCIVLEWHKWLVKREELFPVLENLGFTHSELLEGGKSTELWLFSRT